MLNITLILCKIVLFVLFRSHILEKCHKFYTLFANQFAIIIDESQNKFCSHQANKKNDTYDNRYNQLNRSSYQDSVYTVKPGDTLFYIAWITGNNYLDLAKNNNIKNVHVLQVNQVLQVKSNTMNTLFLTRLLKKILLPFDNSYYKITKLFTFNKKRIDLQVKQCLLNNINRKNPTISYKKNTTVVIPMYWIWPTYGSITNTFSDTEGGNTGIDISGSFNQPILATTTGKVVYVGNVLKGYGNLVIIKHTNNYLSAYAHNNKILVTEQQYVKIGDQIATMGNSGTNAIKLHFEIRHKGKSINPLHLLP